MVPLCLSVSKLNNWLGCRHCEMVQRNKGLWLYCSERRWRRYLCSPGGLHSSQSALHLTALTALVAPCQSAKALSLSLRLPGADKHPG